MLERGHPVLGWLYRNVPENNVPLKPGENTRARQSYHIPIAEPRYLARVAVPTITVEQLPDRNAYAFVQWNGQTENQQPTARQYQFVVPHGNGRLASNVEEFDILYLGKRKDLPRNTETERYSGRLWSIHPEDLAIIALVKDRFFQEDCSPVLYTAPILPTIDLNHGIVHPTTFFNPEAYNRATTPEAYREAASIRLAPWSR